MDKITKITIKSASGYCSYDMAYSDKIAITENSISYEYKPVSEERNGSKWSYKTNNAAFKEAFEGICEEAIRITMDGSQECMLDCTTYEIVITYDDKEKEEFYFAIDTDYFEPLFKIVKKLVPSFEQVPEVVKTSEDWED